MAPAIKQDFNAGLAPQAALLLRLRVVAPRDERVLGVFFAFVLDGGVVSGGGVLWEAAVFLAGGVFLETGFGVEFFLPPNKGPKKRPV